MTMPKRGKAGTSKAAAADRRAKFVEAYIANSGNATQAAIAAGYSPQRARVQGAELVADRNIAETIAKRRAEVIATAEAETGIKVARFLEELRRIVLADPRRLFDSQGRLLPVQDWPDDVAAMVASVEVDEIKVAGQVVGQTKKVKLWDKNSALDKAMKHLGLFERDNAQKPPLEPPVIHVHFPNGGNPR